jgi:hypothetical protein
VSALLGGQLKETVDGWATKVGTDNIVRVTWGGGGGGRGGHALHFSHAGSHT